MIRYWHFYAIGALIVALTASGWLLKRAWQAEAASQAQVVTVQNKLDQQQQMYTQLRDQQAMNSMAVAEVSKQKQALQEQNSELSRQLRNAPDASQSYRDCMGVALPDSITGRLRNQAGDDHAD